MWFNFALEAAIIANLSAQIIKVPIQLLIQRKWNPRMLISTGGMPSSHSAFVSALATAIALQEGMSSPLFAIAFCFAAVVTYDATGIRRHAGTHAALLNKLLDDLEQDGTMAIFQDPKYQKRFKELLGHEPMEMIVGTLFGIAIAFLYHSFM